MYSLGTRLGYEWGHFQEYASSPGQNEKTTGQGDVGGEVRWEGDAHDAMPVLPQAVVLALLAVHGSAARLSIASGVAVVLPADPYCRKRPYWSSPSRPVFRI